MFNIGWSEIILVIVAGVVIIGPERLPGVIQDLRAAVFAARKAINNAKAELNGELGDLGQEFEDLRGPLSQAAEWGRLGPRGVITKALFEGDDSAWDDFNLRKGVSDALGDRPHLTGSANPAPRPQDYGHYDASAQQPAAGNPMPGNSMAPGQHQAAFDYSTYYAPQEPVQSPPQQPQRGEGGSWNDVT